MGALPVPFMLADGALTRIASAAAWASAPLGPDPSPLPPPLPPRLFLFAPKLSRVDVLLAHALVAFFAGAMGEYVGASTPTSFRAAPARCTSLKRAFSSEMSVSNSDSASFPLIPDL